MFTSACICIVITGLLTAQVTQKQIAPKPPLRTHAEVNQVLGRTTATAAKERSATFRQLHVLLLDAKKDHGPGEHDYPAWKKKWSGLFGKLDKVTVDTAYEWPTDDELREADVVVCYYWNHDWSPARYGALDEYLKRGGGLVMLHSSVIADRGAEQLAGRLGLAFQPDRMKYRHGELDLKMNAADHPILQGMPPSIPFHDETYWPPLGDAKTVHVLATTVEEGKSWPILWTSEPGKEEGGKGRVFCSVLGHYSWTFDDPLFRIIVLRGTAWAAREPVGRFEKLALEGVKLNETQSAPAR
jgi:type 1 glutamine amidotransferase